MKVISYSEIPENFYNYRIYKDTESVKEIIERVIKDGDSALKEVSAEFGEKIDTIKLSKEEIEDCIAKTPAETVKHLKKAVKNIKNFAEKQLESLKELETEHKGSKIGHKIIPIETIGAYAPGGNYPLPSSAIMTIVPARVANVKKVILCSPKIHPVTVCAAHLSGVDEIFRVGGAQAIAAMAYGTESIPAVDKIVGPGNKYVTQAKKHVYGKCGIDFLAGPSEIMIIADETAIPSYIAADFLSQAEHDVDAQSILISLNDKITKTVVKEIDKQLENLATKEIAKKSLENSYIITVDSLDQAIIISNKKAPEHLQLCFQNADKLLDAYTNYGSLFIGNYSAEVFGDYCSGPNHVLPTNGVARYCGGLSVFDFIKIQTYQYISEKHAKENLIQTSEHLAGLEGLLAHKNAALIRN